MKKEILINETLYSILYVLQFIAFIVSTIAVAVFQFNATAWWLQFSLIGYVVSFAIMAVTESISVSVLQGQIASCKKELEDNKAKLKEKANEIATDDIPNSVLEDGAHEVTADDIKRLKGQITWGYIKTVLCFAVAVFALIVLIKF